jgi:uncharacterized protein (DUF58 family)
MTRPRIAEAQLAGLTRLAERLLAGRRLAAGDARPRRRRPGSGTELLDFRPYTAGDELRRVNWRLSARSHWPQVRTDRDESGGEWLLCLDRSASMGTDHETWQLALDLTAAYAWLLLASGNRVALATWAAGVDRYLPPRAGRSQYRHLLDVLDTTRPDGAGTGLETCAARLPRGGCAVVVSDFLAEDGLRGGLTRLTQLADRMHALQVRSARLLDLPAGHLTLVDAETGRRLETEVQQAGAQPDGQRRLEALDQALEAFCRRHAIPHRRWLAGEPWLPGLVSHLAHLEAGVA